MRLYDATGRLSSTLETDVHPAREMGRVAGRNHAGNEALFEQVVETSLAAVLDRKAEEFDRLRSGQYLLGFAEGWGEIMAIEPLFRLTRQETARVQTLPEPIRKAWMAEYEVARMIVGGKLPRIPEAGEV